MSRTARRIALVTGAAGGIGLASARVLGTTMDVVVTDLRAERLDATRASLEADGVGVVAAVPGPLQDAAVTAALADTLPGGRSLDVLVHAAGQASVQGDWQSSVEINIVGTRRLLDVLGPRMASGSAAILLSSLAGHAPVPRSAIDAIATTDWDDPGLIARLTPHLDALDAGDRAGRCYVVAKRIIIDLARTLAIAWGARDVRILSISPGLVDTPMGRAEATGNPAAMALPDMIPLGRLATANDIAAAIGFLVSPAAGYITGTDLKIDGGLQAALDWMAAAG